jgi:DNA invertase Pin-like site-specific DNA recombinase
VRNQESLRLQYGLRDRAGDLGWRADRILIIDDDLGKSGASTEDREGFQRLVSEVTLGHVGIILGVEMSRLARSCRDWYQLLEVCGLFGTLIADQDGVYDPTRYNDRLLLGLKGTMSEAELHILKQRLWEGKLAKARRGELWIPLPRGYVRQPSGAVILDPDAQVQQVVRLVFEKFEELGTVNAVLQYFVHHGVRLGKRLPGGPRKGELEWTRPNRATLQDQLKSPIYAGAYAYGRKQTDPRRRKPGRPYTGILVRPREEWHALIRDRLPAYISWEQYEANLARLKSNRAVLKEVGAPREGSALFAGLLYCGRCGRRMVVRYRGRNADPTFLCGQMMSGYGEEFCQSLSSCHLEPYLAAKALEAIAPAALELSLEATRNLERERERLHRLWHQRRERATYEAERAARQYRLVEPENRLVVRQLEQDWEAKLLEQQEVEEEYRRFSGERPRILTAEEREGMRRLAQNIPAIWLARTTTNSDRKEILRQMIDRVVVDVRGKSELVEVAIHWAGGHVTRGETIRPVARYEQLSQFSELCQRIREMLRSGMTYKDIASQLNEGGFRPPRRAGGFLAQDIGTLRQRYGLGELRQKKRLPPLGDDLRPNEWSLADLAREIPMPAVTLYSWVRRGWVTAVRRQEPRVHWIIQADEREIERLRELQGRPQGYYTRRKWLAAAEDESSDP